MEPAHRRAQELLSSPQLIRIPNGGRRETYTVKVWRQANWHWKKIGSAAGFGVAFGLFAAAVASPTVVNTTVNSPAEHVVSRRDAQELSRLQTRNRRLEALVQVLRSRAQSAAERAHDGSTSQDISPALGQ